MASRSWSVGSGMIRPMTIEPVVLAVIASSVHAFQPEQTGYSVLNGFVQICLGSVHLRHPHSAVPLARRFGDSQILPCRFSMFASSRYGWMSFAMLFPSAARVSTTSGARSCAGSSGLRFRRALPFSSILSMGMPL